MPHDDVNVEETLEYSNINGNIKDLNALKITSSVRYVNLHCNQITKITNFSHLVKLKYLDLSSNYITEINGLESCRSLESLFLASNQIQNVTGLEQLSFLRFLDLSFNRISNLSGLRHFRKSTHKLEKLYLFGNKITSVKEITENLCQCQSLKVLLLQKLQDSNPVCKLASYWPNVWAQLPWLHSLDGLTKNKEICDDNKDSDDIPGFEGYVELLAPSISTTNTQSHVTSASSDVDNIVTPKIDEALARFRNSSPPQYNIVTEAEKPCEDESLKAEEMKSRLLTMEKTLSNFVHLYSNTQMKNSVVSQYNSLSSGDEFPRKIKESVSTKHSSSEVAASSDNVENVRRKTKNAVTDLSNKSKRKYDCSNPQKGTKKFGRQTVQVENHKQVRPPEEDETYLALLNEIDGERERRWKSEQATKKLVETIKTLQERLIEEKKIQDAAISSNSKYKLELEKERSARKIFEEDCNKFKVENEKLSAENEELHVNLRTIEKEYEEIKKLTAELEKEKSSESLHNKKLYQELQFKAAGSARELSLLKNTTEKQKGQILQLQDLLVAREQEHKEKLTGMVNVEGKEVRQLIEKELAAASERNYQLIEQHKKAYEMKCEEYLELENEFRMALQIEAHRFNELHATYTNLTEDFNETSTMLQHLTQKESKSRDLIKDLSSMVKEQKVRITELLKSKTELQEQYKSHIITLESEIEKLRKSSSKCESLEQDKERLAAHIRGQESIINGLRSERKLWGEELAQQGASLSKERGKLESLSESQRKEIVSLQTKLKDVEDSLRIKTKLVEDQTETIRSIKEEMRLVIEKNAKLSDEENREREIIEEELNKYKEINEELQEKVDGLTDRKEQLKDELANVKRELNASQDNNKALSSKWKERSLVIDQLEGKVYKMKSTFDEKESKYLKDIEEYNQKMKELEAKLKQEKENHIEEKRKLKADQELQIRAIKYESEKIIERTNEKVAQVEEEMRTILKEKADEKRKFNIQISKLKNAFSEIHKEYAVS